MRTATLSGKITLWLCGFAAVGITSARAQEASFQSRQVTPAGEYTFGIEGPAVDAHGNLYVVNFSKAGTIGKLANGASQSELFAGLPEGSIGVAIRFDAEGRMFVADYRNHNIFLVSQEGKEIETYFHSDDFNQPNDLTVAVDGTLYASDPNWKRHDGQIWRIHKSADGTVLGERMTAGRKMSTTNGIDLSPDGKTLYGGDDGKTVFVTQRQGGFIEAFRSDRPGREACFRACAGRK
jgi:hypothetical protein